VETERVALFGGTPEEQRRFALHAEVRSVKSDVSMVLDNLLAVIEWRDWEKAKNCLGVPMSFLEYMTTPWADGGIDWSVENLKVIMQLRHRNENHVPVALKMAELREFVREQIARVEIALPKPGGDRTKEQVRIANLPARQDDSRYALQRLKRDRPDIAEKVIKGEMSPHAAAVQAGFRKPTLSVPVDSPCSAVRALLRRFSREELLDALKGVAS
jgi:hypothetical protein